MSVFDRALDGDDPEGVTLHQRGDVLVATDGTSPDAWIAARAGDVCEVEQ